MIILYLLNIYLASFIVYQSTKLFYQKNSNKISFVEFFLIFSTLIFAYFNNHVLFPILFIIVYLTNHLIYTYRRKSLYKKLEQIINSYQNQKDSITITDIEFCKSEIIIYYHIKHLSFNLPKSLELKNYYPNQLTTNAIIKNVQLHYNTAQTIIDEINH